MLNRRAEHGICVTHSHFPILAGVVANTSGPVLELGCGHGSTPMLHEICKPTQRRLDSWDDYAPWAEEFRYLQTAWHSIGVVPSREAWKDCQFGGGWSVVFVDHGNAIQRCDSILQFTNGEAEWVVVHDASTPYGEPYFYERVIHAFRFAYAYDDYHSHSLVLSQHREWASA